MIIIMILIIINFSVIFIHIHRFSIVVIPKNATLFSVALVNAVGFLCLYPIILVNAISSKKKKKKKH